MKKLAAIFIIFILFMMQGCSLFYVIEAAPQNIYKEFIGTDSSETSSFSEEIANHESACVVTILTSGSVSVANDVYFYSNVFSGIILNDDGYILTSAQVCNFSLQEDGQIYTGKFTEAYAVLADQYNDQKHYKLNYVDHSDESGLALFQFYDRFYYYTDDSRAQTKSGFQFVANFSSSEIQTGAACAAVGNSLGNILVENPLNHSSFKNVKLTITEGIVSLAKISEKSMDPISFQGKKYYQSLVSSPINADMIGGAVFNTDGTVLGMISGKISSDTTQTPSYFRRMSTVDGVELISDYICSMSDELQVSISVAAADA